MNRLRLRRPSLAEITDSTTIAAIERNSLCQFWNDSNQNRDDRHVSLASAAAAVRSLLLVVSAKPPSAWTMNDTRNNRDNAMPQRVLVEPKHEPPRRTGHGTSGLSRTRADPRRRAPLAPGRFDSADPF